MAIPKPSFETVSVVSRIGRRSDVNAGAYLRGQLYGHDVRRYRLIYRRGQLDASRLSDLLSEYASTGGGATTTTYTPSGGSPATVRFVGGSLRYESQSSQSYSAEVEIEEEIF